LVQKGEDASLKKAGLSPCFFIPFRHYPKATTNMNRLITFEGIEGCGKTTQIKMAGQCLKGKGIPFIVTDEPGGTPLGKRIREVLLNRGPYSISSDAELFLFIAARSQHVKDVMLPALEQGKWILCDRFLDATLAYQGFGRGLDLGFIRRLHEFSAASLKPGLTILLDLPVEMGLGRAMDRIARSRGIALEDRFEREDIEFHRRIREGYLTLAKEDPERYRIIDAVREIDAVHRDVCAHLKEFMER
jgi:dTMP kinase